MLAKIEVDKVISVATKARENFLRKNPDAPRDLSEYCAIASAFLFKCLKKAGFFPIFIVATDEVEWSHVFILVADYLVDITASQFGKPDVCVFKDFSVPYTEWYWVENRIFLHTIEDLIVHQKSKGWPEEQMPKIRRKKLLSFFI